MPKCCVPFCLNSNAGHRFPKDPSRKKVWLMAIQRTDLEVTDDSRICRKHFLPSNYVMPKDSIRRNPLPVLRKDAIPTVFTNNTENNGATKETSDESQNKKIKVDTDHQIGSTSKTSFIKSKELDTSSKTTNVNSAELPNRKNKLNKEIKKEVSAELNSKDLRNRSARLRNKKASLELSQCSVPKCNAKLSKEISLHHCPNNATVRNDWAEALNVSYQYVKNMVACSLHFLKSDFMTSIHSGERALKPDAVPSQNLSKIKDEIVYNKQKPIKYTPNKELQRSDTMTDDVHQNTIVEESRECRACLSKYDDKKSWCNVFQAWAPPWKGMEPTIASDLAKLANIEISENDKFSKIICLPCYQKLLDAATFVDRVRVSDFLLRMRYPFDKDIKKIWPQPIQVDKSLDGSVFSNAVDVEIKQEQLSDEEYTNIGPEISYGETELPNLDIKIEPEEIIEPPPMNITINGTMSLDPLNAENLNINGMEEFLEDNNSNMEVKEEPMSEGEPDNDQIPDLPLECLLCTKDFNSVTGLKAHVIAQHSYVSVKRKSNGNISPEKKRKNKYVCAICRRCFLTSTDLMVHETCHNKHACYSCKDNFDTFEQLTKHRKRCKGSQLTNIQKLKTLEDVKRPLPTPDNIEVKGDPQPTEIAVSDNLEKTRDEDTKELISETTQNSTEQNSEMNIANPENADNMEVTDICSQIVVSDVKMLNTDFEIDNNIKISSPVAIVESNSSDCLTAIGEHDDTENNMKLHLEIHSGNSGTESSELNDIEMHMKTLHDDCA